MGKKKSFIDKKNSSTYHVVRRSERDVGDETTGDGTTPLSKFVLMPSPHNKPAVMEGDGGGDEGEAGGWSQAMQSQLSSIAPNVLDDQNELFDRFTKPISNDGVLLDTRGHVVTGKHNSQVPQTHTNALDGLVGGGVEVERTLESIAISPEYMDEDIAEALFGDWDDGDGEEGGNGGFEEILDDFCLTANQAPVEGEEAVEEFDYEAHIRELMERAQRNEGGGAAGGDGDVESCFRGMAPLKSKHDGEESVGNNKEYILDEYDDLSAVDDQMTFLTNATSLTVSRLSPSEEAEAQKRFMETLGEYDSDDDFEDQDQMEEKEEEPMAVNARLENVLEEYIQDRNDDVIQFGNQEKHHGSGYSALVGQTMVAARELPQSLTALSLNEHNTPETVTANIRATLTEANEILADPILEPPPEDVLIDGQSYFSVDVGSQWDCESILSTYSNTDHHPTTIGKSKRRLKKQNKQKQSQPPVLEDEELVQIQLSTKTGLPLEFHPNNTYTPSDTSTTLSVNKGNARPKNETLEQKKARKQEVKLERQRARETKKLVKECYADELGKRTMNVVENDVGGTTVFRYS